jgi:hypothetical protein
VCVHVKLGRQTLPARLLKLSLSPERIPDESLVQMLEISRPPQKDDLSTTVHRGSCMCGAVTYSVSSHPLLSAYCHCTLCQRLNRMPLLITSAHLLKAHLDSPFVHTVHFPESAFAWTHPEPHEDALQSFAVPQKPWKIRWRCKLCGACVCSQNVKANKRSIWSVHLERDGKGKVIRWDELMPTAHIFYGSRMLDINDELSKWEGYEGRSAQIRS